MFVQENGQNRVHGGVLTWERFPHYWPFEWGVQSFVVFFVVNLNKMMNKTKQVAWLRVVWPVVFDAIMLMRRRFTGFIVIFVWNVGF